MDDALELAMLLNTACELLTELEHNATPDQQERINALFTSVMCKCSRDAAARADLEAQDWDVFGTDKI